MSKTVDVSLKNKERHYIEYILPFFILLSQYSIGVLNIGTLALIVVGIILTIQRSWKVPFPFYYKPFILFLMYIIARDLIRLVLGPDAFQTQINRIVEYFIIFFFVFAVCTQNFSEDKLYKIWKIAGVIFTIGLLYQIFQIYILGQHISPISIVPGYVLRPDEKVTQMRPSSFFAEPASFVNAMIPLEFMSLKRKDFKWAAFTTVAILLSGSTVGVILSLVLWTMELLRRDNSFWKRTLIVIIAAIISVLFMNLDVFNFSFTKFLEVASGESTFGSRVATGFEVIRRQTILEFIFGTNYNDVATFVSSNISNFSDSAVVMIYWRSGRLFLNTFSRLIFQYGVIGLLLFLNPLIQYMRQSNYKAKMLVVTTIVAIFGQTMLLNTYYFMLVILFLLYEEYSLNNVEE